MWPVFADLPKKVKDVYDYMVGTLTTKVDAIQSDITSNVAKTSEVASSTHYTSGLANTISTNLDAPVSGVGASVAEDVGMVDAANKWIGGSFTDTTSTGESLALNVNGKGHLLWCGLDAIDNNGSCRVVLDGVQVADVNVIAQGLINHLEPAAHSFYAFMGEELSGNVGVICCVHPSMNFTFSSNLKVYVDKYTSGSDDCKVEWIYRTY